MILEHEIPNGSKLYFAKSAKLKREIENIASSILDSNGYEEIVSPIFSYHQHLSIADEKELIRINDSKNNSISLRADSTIDVVRIIEKRLGRNTQQKKWFYIQPVLRYPTEEQYQVGVEFMGEKKLSSVLNIAIDIFDKLEVSPLIQISNMKIPHIVSSLFDDLSLDDFKHVNIEKFLNLKVELLKMKELCEEIACKNSVLAPMYYAKMLYYDELFFRSILGNEVFARGGKYNNNNVSSVGFAIYTDTIIEEKVQ